METLKAILIVMVIIGALVATAAFYEALFQRLEKAVTNGINQSKLVKKEAQP